MIYPAISMLPLPETDGALIPANGLRNYIGIAPQTLARWRCTGDGPPFLRVGRRIFYQAADVREWLQARRHNNTILAAAS